MFQIVKKTGKQVRAYCLGEEHPVLSALMAEGKLVSLGNGTYEVMSEEAACGSSGKGQLARAGDYLKLSSAGDPYPNTREFFLANHRHIAEDTYEQIPKPLAAWDVTQPMCEEVAYLVEEKGLVIDPGDRERYFTAFLWGTLEAAPQDAVIVFYSVTRDERGRITDADFNFVVRREFERDYRVIE